MKKRLDVLILVGVCLYFAYDRCIRDDASQFANDLQAAVDAGQPSPGRQQSHGTIDCLRDDFTGYRRFSRLLDSFETSLHLEINGRQTEGQSRTDSYHGQKSIEISLSPAQNPSQDAGYLLKRTLRPVDLSHWVGSGIVTAWIHLAAPKAIPAIGFRLLDEEGKRLDLGELKNYLGPEPNLVKQDDAHSDYYFPEDDCMNKWEDFMLAEGWNYLFWRLDSASANEIDMKKVVAYEILISTSSSNQPLVIALDDVRISDGLQRVHNPLGGEWYSPKGLPQFGVFDVNDGTLRLMNVRETQYPSNGDHGRILTRGATPENFAMKVRFAFKGLPDQDQLLRTRKNTWLRIAYDFEGEYDAGHDWFGVFLSLEYEKFGLVTIIPQERFFRQTEEPCQAEFTRQNRTKYSPEEGQIHELHLTVRGQYAKATLYHVTNDERLRRVAAVEHTFRRPRHGIGKCPIAIETTGNTHLLVHSVDVVALE